LFVPLVHSICHAKLSGSGSSTISPVFKTFSQVFKPVFPVFSKTVSRFEFSKYSTTVVSSHFIALIISPNSSGYILLRIKTHQNNNNIISINIFNQECLFFNFDLSSKTTALGEFMS